uniref:GDT1 family protein n=1 Tax=Anopheles maculatus TaxID=74869 RepID=A0A182SY58_9DIPT
MQLTRSMSGSRKETVELVPLSDTEDQRMNLPRRHAGSNSGSIHSLIEQQQQHHQQQQGHNTTSSGATLRLSASAAQLTTSGSSGPLQQHSSVSRSKSGISTDAGVSVGASSIDTGNGNIVANGGGGVDGEGGGGGGGTGDGSTGNGGGTVLESSRSKLLLLDSGSERGEQRQRLRTAHGSVPLTAGAVQDPTNNATSVVTGSTANGSANQHKMHEREVNAGGSLMGQDAESGGSTSRRGTGRGRNNSALKMLLRIFMQAFTMTFVAEWGDRSQLTTVILSARENVYGVIAGGIIGHSICTGLAVIGGRMIAQRISVRTGKHFNVSNYLAYIF